MKKRNEGFTLVELVIAVVILAIAVTPLFANFIQSGKMNLTSRKNLNAMNLAQDIMEGMSQYSYDENVKYFWGETVSGNNTLVNARVLPGGTTMSSADASNSILQFVELDPSTGAPQYVTSPTTGKKSIVLSSDNSTANSVDTLSSTKTLAEVKEDNPVVYNFKLKNVVTAVGNYNAYDIDVKFDASNVNEDTEGAFNVNGKTLEGNDFAAIKQIDQYFDAVHTIPAEEEANAISQLISQSKKPATAPADYDGKVSRDINIIIGNNGDADNPDYTLQVETVYSVIDIYKNSLGFDATHSHVVTIRTSNLSKASSVVMPRSIYLYFTGMKKASTSNRLEQIHIKNTTNNDFTTYLVRTVVPGAIDTTYNQQYACDIFVDSKESALATANYVDNVDIVSNLRMDLAYDDLNFRVYKEQTSQLLDTLTQDEIANATSSHYLANRSHIFYNSNTQISEENYVKHISDGYARQKKSALCDVTIDIREAGKDRVIAHFTGGLSN